jgi:phosphoglucomutase
MILHPATGFPVGDPAFLPFDALPSRESIERAFQGLILSASGWRKVFARSGDEEDPSPELSIADIFLSAGMAASFAEFLAPRAAMDPPRVLVGIDSRPTGPAIADAMLRAFLGAGFEVDYLFIVCAPELMAHCARAGRGDSGALVGRSGYDGFAYVSASHNPVGHNGVKFGLADGAVLAPSLAKGLIEAYKASVASEGFAERMAALMRKADPKALARAYSSCSMAKRRSASDYLLFTQEVVAGSEDDADARFAGFAQAIAAAPLGAVIDFNGSARAASVDVDMLSGLGVKVRALNADLRGFAHRIVPEGESLEPARAALQAAHAEDPSFLLGYCPDCDGDRGNLVYWDEDQGEARILGAQEVFALACLAELSEPPRSGGGLGRAVVVNDPTSLRVDELAEGLGAAVFRAEVGEANVVGLAAALREKGYEVRVLGEGSNGGFILHPAKVRDPLNTVFAMIKLLRPAEGRPSRGLGSTLRALPRYSTTSVFEAEAALKVSSSDLVALKSRYEAVFRREWPRKAAELGFASWEAIAYNGEKEEPLRGSFAESGRGGLKLLLRDGQGRPSGFLWMRASGTEPVFRIMADARGGPERERALFAWHRGMLLEADRA